jgi:hypothetical protein
MDNAERMIESETVKAEQRFRKAKRTKGRSKPGAVGRLDLKCGIATMFFITPVLLRHEITELIEPAKLIVLAG